MDDLGFLVDDGILDMDVLGNRGIASDDGVLQDGALLDADASSEDGVDDRPFDDGTIGDIGIRRASALLVEDGGGVIGLGVDRPVLAEEGRIGLLVEKFEGGLEIVAQRIEGADIAFVADGLDEDGGGDVVQRVGDGEEGRGPLGIFQKAFEHRIVHDKGSHGDIAFVHLARLISIRVTFPLSEM